MSASYLFYHVYLLVAVIHALWSPEAVRARLATYLGIAFAVGLPSYLLVPAVGPRSAFPAIFSDPLAGGAVSSWTAYLVDRGSSVYDAFPSLHVMITLVLLDFDWRCCRRRFFVAVAPAAALGISTMYLRHHYAVDLVAGVIWFLGARFCYERCGLDKLDASLPRDADRSSGGSDGLVDARVRARS